MENKNYLTPTRKDILRIIGEHKEGISAKKVVAEIGILEQTVYSNLRFLEHRLGLIERKPADEGKVFTMVTGPAKIKKPSESQKLQARLMKLYKLDELEFKILEEVEVYESIPAIAQTFNVLGSVIEARMKRSIPAKFETVSFEQAKARFQEVKGLISCISTAV